MSVSTVVLILVAIAGGVTLGFDRGLSAYRPSRVPVRTGKYRR